MSDIKDDEKLVAKPADEDKTKRRGTKERNIFHRNWNSVIASL